MKILKRSDRTKVETEEMDEETKELLHEVTWPIIEKRLMIQREMAKRRMESFLHRLSDEIVHFADHVVRKNVESGVRLDYVAIRDIENDTLRVVMEIRIKPDSQKLFGVPE
jgi:hypothetical protein